MKKQVPFLLIISGPTASGKTDFSLKISEQISSQIINADVGQFYQPLTIGTAKPDWKKQKVKHHLYDILDEPKDLSVVQYNKLVMEKVHEILEKKQLPIIVGGSLFYLKSLYFPPKQFEKEDKSFVPFDTILLRKITQGERHISTAYSADVASKAGQGEQENLWDILNQIDPKRASQLHPNDHYRIQRALQIWQETGIKPCEYKPEFKPQFNSLFVFISPPKDILFERINQRTKLMIKQGWIQEAKNLIGTEWEVFLKTKGLIGYPEIFEWISNSEKEEKIPELIEKIQQQTRQYAKRQITFWKSLKKQFIQNKTKSDYVCDFIEIEDLNQGVEKIFVAVNRAVRYNS